MLEVINYPINEGKGLQLKYAIKYTKKYDPPFQILSTETTNYVKMLWELPFPINKFKELIKLYHGKISTTNIILFNNKQDAQDFIDYLDALLLMNKLQQNTNYINQLDINQPIHIHNIKANMSKSHIPNTQYILKAYKQTNK